MRFDTWERIVAFSQRFGVKKPPGGLEDACLRSPKRGVELPGGFPARGREEEEAAIFAEKFIDIFNEIARVFIVH